MVDYNLDAEDVNVAITGGAFVGPELTTPPTGFTEAPTNAKSAGYLNQDAVNINDGSSVTPIVAWQNNDQVRNLEDTAEVTVEYTSIANGNVEVKEQFYGGPADADGGYAFTGKSGGRKALYLYAEDTTKGIVDLYIFPSVEKQPGSERNLVSTDANGFPFVWTVYRKFGFFYKHYTAPLGS